MKLIEESRFPQIMEEEAEPFLAGCRKTGKLGDELWYETYFLPESRATVVISHGFTEAAVKYHEMIYLLLREGFSCAILDHRGHGSSPRMASDPQVVHIDRFHRYVEDFHRFTEEIVRPEAAGELYLLGHSMGGCIAARILEEYPGEYQRAVLNAPMLGINSGNIPTWAGLLICRAMILLGKGEEKLFFHKNFQPDLPFEEDFATSRARFEYYQALRRENPSLQTSAASYRWTKESIQAGRLAVKEAGKIRVPVLLLQAGNDTLVTAEAQEEFIRKVPDGRLVTVPGAKHEIYRSDNETLENYWNLILDFFARKRP